MDFIDAVGDLLITPELFALLIVIIGLILARLASKGVSVLLDVIDRRTARLSTSEVSLISPRVIRMSRGLVFWILLILAVSQALRVLGVGGVPVMLNTVLQFLPRLLVAFSIVLAGHLLGLAAAHLTTRLRDGLSPTSTGPRLVYGSVLTVAIVMGAQHIDVDISFLTQLLLILVGTVSAGIMLAFGLGARQHVANLLARRELSRLAVGQRVRIDDVDGTVVDIHDTALDIATDDGVRSVPAGRLAEVGVLVLAEAEGDA